MFYNLILFYFLYIYRFSCSIARVSVTKEREETKRHLQLTNYPLRNMPIKNYLNRFQPAPLFIVLFLSICYFSVQLILSHLTHALTLLMASYHMLCNILALAGSIVTIKVSFWFFLAIKQPPPPLMLRHRL